ncbi:helix-turn-helix domain-containing protein [Streptomyces sp. 1331.2]|uniref:helix-turn-helix domain-containing protein n=1 Tax=Streptomyces sp. 1331.2 TaxID=1938835 RepID=UPI000BD02C64|nr:helix-turn-helix domain-containing protein [Streptomyces sp. 1331.2]SOB79326.1 PucR C-terminal helix-turn-helix domain-containing protein [Streptomyces sp. 1331.2]
MTRILKDETAVVDSFMAAIAREIPAYANLDARQLAEVRSIIVWTLRRVLELWSVDGELDPSDLRMFRGVGAVRARDARPLAAVLRAYRVAALAFFERIGDGFADGLSAADTAALARVWLTVLDQSSEAIFDGYESTGRSLSEDRERSLRGLLTDLLLGRQSHTGTLRARLRELDAQLPPSFDLVVADPAGSAAGPSGTAAPTGAAEDAERAASVVAAALDARAAGEAADRELAAIHTTMDGVGVALVKAVDPQELDRLMTGHGLTGALLTGATAATAPRDYRLAAHGVRHASALVRAERRVLDRGDLEVVALVTGHPDADPARVAGTVLGHLTQEPETLRTLDAVLYSDGAAAAAARLHVHPQTVRYRLRRLAATTGRDPRTPWNGFVFRTALLAAQP